MTSSYRGNGYDNRDPYYYDQMRGNRGKINYQIIELNLKLEEPFFGLHNLQIAF